ncbi:hypothetical protein BC477_11840 [Clavibacter michiganensis subsp. michiganensis]|uniref:Uncharacterized protein n=1 Tax=Clavibacter michiganensis subsp. michiganensis TaxID=33013 RepID=A0A251XI41_CLAMM|nr:hypothetical protein BC477_11840 [Clavibacter michiganensis subsp. michiganensis]OUE02486.1 hypothetical protein CMMCAS07_10750 [Clavibacter michiganensis subsp. michiganensis]
MSTDASSPSSDRSRSSRQRSQRSTFAIRAAVASITSRQRSGSSVTMSAGERSSRRSPRISTSKPRTRSTSTAMTSGVKR